MVQSVYDRAVTLVDEDGVPISGGNPLPTSGGGTGGGAVTIADGADVAEGATTDAAAAAGGVGTISAKLRRISAQLPAALGQAAMVASEPVVIASDQSAIPVTDTRLPATLGQKASSASLAVVLASDQSTITSLGAAKAASATITRSNNTTAYPANSVVGGAQSFPSLGSAGQQIMITSSTFMINDSALISGEGAYILYLYNVTPPSAYADNAAWDLPSGDRASFLGAIALGTPVDLGSTLFIEGNILNKQVTLSGTGLFGYLVTVGAYTPTAQRVYVPAIHTVTLGS